jgi:DUF4097 and DUF4098 domain-containing protein YvlB
MSDPQTPPPLPNEPYYQEQNRTAQPRRWGSTLVIIGVAWLLFELVRRSFFGGFAFGRVEETVSEPTQTFAGATALTVRTTADDIELYHTDEAAIIVDVNRRGFGWNSSSAKDALQRVKVQVSQNGDQVTVVVDRAPTGFGFGPGPQITLRIGVPSGVELLANTASGDIGLQGVVGVGTVETISGDIESEASDGALVFSSTSGDIVVQEHRGNPSVRTVSGDIEVHGTGVANLQVESISGDISLSEVSGNVRAKTTSGYINLEEGRDLALYLESTSGDIDVSGTLASRQEQRVSSVSGNVDLQLSEPQGIRLEATTLSGELESDLDLQAAIRERRRLAGTLGAGDTVLLINTASGDVRVDEE